MTSAIREQIYWDDVEVGDTIPGFDSINLTSYLVLESPINRTKTIHVLDFYP